MLRPYRLAEARSEVYPFYGTDDHEWVYNDIHPDDEPEASCFVEANETDIMSRRSQYATYAEYAMHMDLDAGSEMPEEPIRPNTPESSGVVTMEAIERVIQSLAEQRMTLKAEKKAEKRARKEARLRAMIAEAVATALGDAEKPQAPLSLPR